MEQERSYVDEYKKMKKKYDSLFSITREQAKKIAEEKICDFLTARSDQRLISNYEKPLKAYITNTKSQAGEVFSVNCPGTGDDDFEELREGLGWNCEDLSDEKVIEECCKNGDLSDDINSLTQKIWKSVANLAYPEN